MIERFEKMFKELLDMVLVLKQRCDTIKAERDTLAEKLAAVEKERDALLETCNAMVAHNKREYRAMIASTKEGAR